MLARQTIPQQIRESYPYRIGRQVLRECKSFGEDQIMPILMALVGIWWALHLKVIQGAESHSDYVIALASLGGGLVFYLGWQLLRAPFVLDREERMRNFTLREELKNKAKRVEQLQAELLGTAPKLEIEFEDEDRFFSWSRAVSDGVKLCFVRVLPKPNTPLTRCKGYLESIERLENGKWVSVGWASRPQLHWSEVHEQGIVEVDLLTDNESQFLDVAFVRQNDRAVLPAIDQRGAFVTSLFRQYPDGMFKFGIGIIGQSGDRTVEARIALSFKQRPASGRPVVSKTLSAERT
jgi:hypothetical protein